MELPRIPVVLALALVPFAFLPSCGSTEEAAEVEPPAETADAPEPTALGGVEADASVEPVLRAMAGALRSARSLSFRVESWTDEEMEEGVHYSVGAESRVLLRYPDRLLVDRVGEKGRRVMRYDGASFSVCDPERGLWGRIPAPGTIDGMLDMLHADYGIVVPLADLFVGDPYDAYTSVADRALHLGVHDVRGVPCHQVSLSTDWLAWQIWVPVEGPALPRRVEIRYLDEAGSPRYLAHLDEWKVDPPAEDAAFLFTPPAGSEEIEFRRPTTDGEAPAD
ncbi:MAG: DUF2092 domain-containing protein, partial [Planctomycetes bacterium]|nr:DUF2092 domain-containing protein [Planctomycetota bacterium]